MLELWPGFFSLLSLAAKKEGRGVRTRPHMSEKIPLRRQANQNDGGTCTKARNLRIRRLLQRFLYVGSVSSGARERKSR